MERITKLLTDFRNDRPLMDENNDLHTLVDLMDKEVDEVRDELNGDLDQLAQELADVAIYALTAILEMGRDPEEELLAKISYNHVQHSAFNYQRGDFDIQRFASKSYAKSRKLKEQFYDNR